LAVSSQLRFDVVPAVFTKPRAVTRIRKPGYQPSWYPSGLTTAASAVSAPAWHGEIVAVVADVARVVPGPVARELAALTSDTHCWLAT
jgi:hypothetical protein